MKSFLMIVCLLLVSTMAFANGSYYDSLPEETSYETHTVNSINKFNGPCKRYTTRKVCENQRVCRMVCSAATSGIGNGVCNEVCNVVPNCHDMIICAEYY